MPNKPVKEQLDILCADCEQIIGKEDLVQALEKKTRLKVKIGFDPTAPDLHLGHLVQLNKLKQFQDFGHQIIFLVGDFTARIGDPSGKSRTRPPLTSEQVKENAHTYAQQVYRILDKDNTQIRYNSEWSEKLTPREIIKLMSVYTVARLLEREDFAARYARGDAIALHEFLYPLMQAHDSVALKADLELGGTDQTFNLLAGRRIQREYGQKGQIVMTLPLLEGLDGVKKMSKSLDNYIAFNDAPDDMFGKIMSLPDTLMWRYWQLLKLCTAEELQQMKDAVKSGKNPRDIKIAMATKIVTQLYDPKKAQDAEQGFVNRFSHGVLPKDLPVREVNTGKDGALALPNALRDSQLAASTSEAMRLIRAGAVRLDGKKITDKNMQLKKGEEPVTQVGKHRIARLIIR